jgi:tRNA/rRNA methyltransferase
MTDDPLSRIRVVLVRTSLARNIGSTARAMKAMGITQLALVAPKSFPDAEADALASGADDVLRSARVFTCLEDAIGDCVAAYALSARARQWGPVQVTVREAAGEAIARSPGGEIAFVFGNEASGLTNEELLACRMHVSIPVNPAFRSLNLSQAVQIVAYELRMAAAIGLPHPADGLPPATMRDLEGLYAALDEAALASGFLDPAQPGRLHARWRRLVSRAQPEREEVNILRGLLRALMKRWQGPPGPG